MRWRNRLVASLVLGTMLLMAAIGLAYALLTQPNRRAHDTGYSRRSKGTEPDSFRVPEPSRPVSTRPAQLAALGYVPQGADVLVGVHLAELLRGQTGPLLQNPLKIGPIPFHLAQVSAITGLALEEIDHLVLAVCTDDPILPRPYLVVRTRQPYDGDRIRSTLKAKRVLGSTGRELVTFTMPGSKLDLVLWNADERTLVVGLVPSHMQAVPEKPTQRLEQLPRELRDLLQQRMDKGGALWMAARLDERTRKTFTDLFASRMKKETVQTLQTVQSFAAWLQLEPPRTVQAVFHCQDGPGAQALDRYFRPGDNAAEGGLKSALDGPWLTLQRPTDLETVTQFLGR